MERPELRVRRPRNRAVEEVRVDASCSVRAGRAAQRCIETRARSRAAAFCSGVCHRGRDRRRRNQPSTAPDLVGIASGQDPSVVEWAARRRWCIRTVERSPPEARAGRRATARPFACANFTPAASRCRSVVPAAECVRSEQARTALRDRACKQSLRQRRAHQAGHRDGTSRLPDDRHLTRISAECGDVLLHPAQRSDLIEQAVVAGRASVRTPASARDAQGSRADQRDSWR